MWIHLWVPECRILFSGHCDLEFDLWPQFYKNPVRNISPILFEVGFPNFVCGHILGLQSVAYCFGVTVTLDLASIL